MSDDPFHLAARAALQRQLRRANASPFGQPSGKPPRGRKPRPEPALTQGGAAAAFDKQLRAIAEKGHQIWQVFSDFCEMAALSLSQFPMPNADREARYMQIVGRYPREQVNELARLLPIVVIGLGDEPSADFLGQAFMRLELSNKFQGQFFTPWEVAYLMARVTMDKEATAEEIARVGFRPLFDPTAGSGVMLIAAAAVMRQDGFNPQTQLLVTAQDIAQIPFWMCYIQLALYGIPATVRLGDTLKNEVRLQWHTPMWHIGFWSGKERRGYALGSETDPGREEFRKLNPDGGLMEREREREAEREAAPVNVFGERLFAPTDNDLAEAYAAIVYDEEPHLWMSEEEREAWDRDEFDLPAFYELDDQRRQMYYDMALDRIAGPSGRINAYEEVYNAYGEDPSYTHNWKKPTVYMTDEGYENITWGDPTKEEDYGGMELAREIPQERAVDAPGQQYLFAKEPDADDLVEAIARLWRADDNERAGEMYAVDWDEADEEDREFWREEARAFVAFEGTTASIGALSVAAAQQKVSLASLGFKEPSLYITADGTIEATLQAPEGRPDYAGPAPVGWEVVSKAIGKLLAENPDPDESDIGMAILDALNGIPLGKQLAAMQKQLAGAIAGGGPFGPPKKAGKPEPETQTPGHEGRAERAERTKRAWQVERAKRDTQMEAARARQAGRGVAPRSAGFQTRRAAGVSPAPEITGKDALAAGERLRRQMFGSPTYLQAKKKLEATSREIRAEIATTIRGKAEEMGLSKAERQRMDRETEAWAKRPEKIREELIEREAAKIQLERELAKLPEAQRAAILRQQREAKASAEQMRAEEARLRARETAVRQKAAPEEEKIAAAMAEIERALGPQDYNAQQDRDVAAIIADPAIAGSPLQQGAIAFATEKAERDIRALTGEGSIPPLLEYDAERFRDQLAALGWAKRGKPSPLKGVEPASVPPLVLESEKRASARARMKAIAQSQAEARRSAGFQTRRAAGVSPAQEPRPVPSAVPPPDPDDPTAMEIFMEAAGREQQVEDVRAATRRPAAMRAMTEALRGTRKRNPARTDNPICDAAAAQKSLGSLDTSRMFRELRDSDPWYPLVAAAIAIWRADGPWRRIVSNLQAAYPDYADVLDDDRVETMTHDLMALALGNPSAAERRAIGERMGSTFLACAAIEDDPFVFNDQRGRQFVNALGRAANAIRSDIAPREGENEHAFFVGLAMSVSAASSAIAYEEPRAYYDRQQTEAFRRDILARLCRLPSNPAGTRLMRLAYAIEPAATPLHILHTAEIAAAGGGDITADRVAVANDYITGAGLEWPAYLADPNVRSILRSENPRRTRYARPLSFDRALAFSHEANAVDKPQVSP